MSVPCSGQPTPGRRSSARTPASAGATSSQDQRLRAHSRIAKKALSERLIVVRTSGGSAHTGCATASPQGTAAAMSAAGATTAIPTDRPLSTVTTPRAVTAQAASATGT